MLAGAQRILHARHLTAVNISVGDHQALMPMNFIINTSDTSDMDPITNLSSPGKLFADYSGIQARVDYFWRCWVLEYLPSLQK